MLCFYDLRLMPALCTGLTQLMILFFCYDEEGIQIEISGAKTTIDLEKRYIPRQRYGF